MSKHPQDAGGRFRRPAQSIVNDIEAQADSEQPPSVSVTHGTPPAGPLTPPPAAPSPAPQDTPASTRTVGPGELSPRPFRDPRKNSA